MNVLLFVAETGDVGHACEVRKVPVRVWKLQWCSRVSVLCAVSGEFRGIGAEIHLSVTNTGLLLSAFISHFFTLYSHLFVMFVIIIIHSGYCL